MCQTVSEQYCGCLSMDYPLQIRIRTGASEGSMLLAFSLLKQTPKLVEIN